MWNWSNFSTDVCSCVLSPSLVVPAGSYYLTVAAGNNFVVTGNYRFRLLDFANATVFTPGTVVSSALSPANSTTFYQFAGVAGQRLFFDGLPTGGFNYQPYTRLYTPLDKLIITPPINKDVDTIALQHSAALTLR